MPETPPHQHELSFCTSKPLQTEFKNNIEEIISTLSYDLEMHNYQLCIVLQIEFLINRVGFPS